MTSGLAFHLLDLSPNLDRGSWAKSDTSNGPVDDLCTGAARSNGRPGGGTLDLSFNRNSTFSLISTSSMVSLTGRFPT